MLLDTESIKKYFNWSVWDDQNLFFKHFKFFLIFYIVQTSVANERVNELAVMLPVAWWIPLRRRPNGEIIWWSIWNRISPKMQHSFSGCNLDLKKTHKKPQTHKQTQTLSIMYIFFQELKRQYLRHNDLQRKVKCWISGAPDLQLITQHSLTLIKKGVDRQGHTQPSVLNIKLDIQKVLNCWILSNQHTQT